MGKLAEQAEQEQENFDQQFDDLIDGLGSQQQAEEEPVAEEETTVEEEPQAADGEEPQTVEAEAETEDETETDESVDEAAELDEADELRRQNELLQKRIEELSGQVIYGGYSSQSAPPGAPQPQAGTDDGPKAQQQQPQAPPPQQPAGPPNFLEGVDLDSLYENPEVLNEVLARVHGAATEHGARMAAERVLRQVPELVVGYVSRHTAMTNMVNDFYRENPDLTNVKQTVAAVANDLHAKNPDWDADKIFQETANETRKLLGLKKEAQQRARQASGKKPAFAGQRGTRQQEPKVTGLQKEINDLISEDF